MINLDLQFADAPTIMCVGAHSDDIEIGAGATILGIADRWPSAMISWVVFAASGAREEEARKSAEHFCKGFASADIQVLAFRDGYFPGEFRALKEKFEQIRARIDPDLVLTHHRDDRHQDHCVISDLTWQTFRDQLILEYEIPKYDGELGAPNFFRTVSIEHKEQKLDALQQYFATQHSKPWFSRETFTAIMRLRGVECRSRSGFAEAFYCRKATF